MFHVYRTVQHWIVGSWLKPFFVNEASIPLVDKLHSHCSIMIDIMLGHSKSIHSLSSTDFSNNMRAGGHFSLFI